MVEGPMGSGKSTTAVGYAIDAYKKSGGKAKIYAVNMHLFSTKKLKINYVYCPSIFGLIELINTDAIRDGIIIIDESYIVADSRSGMNPVTKIMTWFAQQIRKRHVHIYYIVQNGRFLEWRLRWMIVRRIICQLDDNVKGRIWLTVKYLQGANRGTEKVFPFDGKRYWNHFDTDELPYVPVELIKRAGVWQ